MNETFALKNVRIFVIVGVIVGISALVLSIDPQTNQKLIYAQPIFDKCHDDDFCTLDELYLLKSTNSTQTLETTIKDLISIYEKSDFYCHHITHHVGEFVFGYFEGDFEKISKLTGYACGAGIVHGTSENIFQIETSLHGKQIDEVDFVGYTKDVDRYWGSKMKKEFAHGVGHSIVKIYDYDTSKSVDKCLEYRDASLSANCYGGVFMQNMKEYSQNRGGDFKPTDLQYPCNKLDWDTNPDASYMCNRYMANYYLSISNYNSLQAQELCMENGKGTDICIKGIASHLAKNNFNEIQRTKVLCDSTDKNYQWQCVRGAAESLTMYVSHDKAKEFCTFWDEPFNSQCVAKVEKIIDYRK